MNDDNYEYLYNLPPDEQMKIWQKWREEYREKWLKRQWSKSTQKNLDAFIEELCKEYGFSKDDPNYCFFPNELESAIRKVCTDQCVRNWSSES